MNEMKNKQTNPQNCKLGLKNKSLFTFNFFFFSFWPELTLTILLSSILINQPNTVPTYEEQAEL